MAQRTGATPPATADNVHGNGGSLAHLTSEILEAITGVGVIVCFPLWETTLQERIPAQSQSRVSSFDYLGTLCLIPLDYLLIGPVAGAFGNTPTAALATAVTLAVAALVACGREVRRLQ